MRDVLETLLSSAGYSVKLARTGEEGLNLYREHVFDVVLLDVSMPGIGGFPPWSPCWPMTRKLSSS